MEVPFSEKYDITTPQFLLIEEPYKECGYGKVFLRDESGNLMWNSVDYSTLQSKVMSLLRYVRDTSSTLVAQVFPMPVSATDERKRYTVQFGYMRIDLTNLSKLNKLCNLISQQYNISKKELIKQITEALRNPNYSLDYEPPPDIQMNTNEDELLPPFGYNEYAIRDVMSSDQYKWLIDENVRSPKTEEPMFEETENEKKFSHISQDHNYALQSCYIPEDLFSSSPASSSSSGMCFLISLSFKSFFEPTVLRTVLTDSQ